MSGFYVKQRGPWSFDVLHRGQRLGADDLVEPMNFISRVRAKAVAKALNDTTDAEGDALFDGRRNDYGRNPRASVSGKESPE